MPKLDTSMIAKQNPGVSRDDTAAFLSQNPNLNTDPRAGEKIDTFRKTVKTPLQDAHEHLYNQDK